jgi:saccharopine dehydrogenase (NAD+, L-lysine forming)
MTHRVGIRREDMYTWERRAPLIPSDAAELAGRHGVSIVAQASPKRVFTDADYRSAGIEVAGDLSSCPVVVGIKEIPIPVLESGKTYVFFSHTIKGQAYNMPMLRRILEMGCTLIDYERVTDDAGRRLIFFGNYAGLAGVIETLWALGERLAWEGIANPFSELERALEYPSLGAAQDALRAVGERIASEGLPPQISPLVIGIAGYGNVSRGAQEILGLLPIEEISPNDLASLRGSGGASDRVVYKVVFKEEHMAQPLDSAAAFDLEEYYTHPERYRGVFDRHLPHLDVLMNCIYWEPRYPRLVTKAKVRELTAGSGRLRVIGDVSCDVEGAVECTVEATQPDDPVYVYDPIEEKTIRGVAGNGPVIMAVEILPSELPRESSTYFSGVLKRYIPAIAGADYTGSFEACNLPPEIKRAVIVYRGELTPDYRHLEPHLDAQGSKGETP